MKTDKSIPMKYNAQLGIWYDPMTWFTPTQKQVNTPPIAPSPSATAPTSPDDVHIPDDFLAPGAQEQIDLDKMAESRKNYMILAGILAVILLVMAGRKKNEKT